MHDGFLYTKHVQSGLGSSQNLKLTLASLILIIYG